ncbi:hypothetical protein WK56_08685 [Burkholderia ubonensis]|uniref:hypothetical protein n=1 Tax=Burkholderia ubonensis TaxID=101571 RepID=UPI00075527F1|nr:hypothetical protein [Burkholderia ubonensis]KVT73691.1 hypothetical protein WK56_08685 [Burkholderia ubonensis]
MTQSNSRADALTDEQIIERCKAAGIKWIPPELPDNTDYEIGFPGSFDMVNMSEMRALLAASPVEQPVAAPQNDTRFTHPGCDVCACPEGVCQADRSFFRQPAAAPADERAATFDQWKEKYADVFSNEGDAWYAWNAARAAASPAAEAVAIPVEVIAWRDAYQAHVDASTAYYSLLHTHRVERTPVRSIGR